MTVTDLMEDRLTLDGVLMKCNQSPADARTDPECLTARVAIERLARDADRAREAKLTEDFEHTREQRRIAQERVRQEHDANARFDPYSLPLVPVEPSAPSASQNSATGPARP